MKTKSNQWVTNSKRNVRHLAYWTGSWVLTLAIVTFGQEFIWNYNTSISIILITINTIVGVGMILMNRKYLNGLDEMQRKINMEAMAFALGIGVVGGLSYSTLENAKVISFHADIAHLIILIGITYYIGILVSTIRYK